jgi:hypothetical protein
MAMVGWKGLVITWTWVDTLKAIFLMRGAFFSAGEVSRIGLQAEIAGKVWIIFL